MTKDEAYPASPDRIDPVGQTDPEHRVRIEYYAHGTFIGQTMIKKGQNQSDRETAAKETNIEFFDEFRLDNGRVVAKLTDQRGFFDEQGKLWIVENKP